MFSATFNELTKENAQRYVGDLKSFFLKSEALKLKGVQHFRITLNDEEKIKFIVSLFKEIMGSLSMIFVNKKKTASEI